MLGLEGHFILGNGVSGGGFPLLRPIGEEVGNDLVIKVPYIGQPEFLGHPLLVGIGEVGYLQLLIDQKIKEAETLYTEDGK